MNDIEKIANMLTEDPNIFTRYEEKYRENTTLDDKAFVNIVSILNQVARSAGLKLDVKRLSIAFNPAGLTIKNIYLDFLEPRNKQQTINKLANQIAKSTGDDNIKNNFSKNLRVNLYSAVNKEFADRVREELNLDVTHQFESHSNPKLESLPMATFIQPAAVAKKPEEELEEPELMNAEPNLGPSEKVEELPELEDELNPEVPDQPLEMQEEPQEEPEESEETTTGEEAPPPTEEELDEMIPVEGINYIANLLTDDPDIFNF